MTNALRISLVALLTVAMSAIAPLSASAQPHRHRHPAHVVSSRHAKASQTVSRATRHHHLATKAKSAKANRHRRHSAVAPVPIHRHAQLCQQVMVHQHWVSHCR
jgi:hypothetical protein